MALIDHVECQHTIHYIQYKHSVVLQSHLVQGKSPVQKVRVKDVDQRVYQDDDEFIWAELESSQSEDEISDYQPSIQDVSCWWQVMMVLMVMGGCSRYSDYGDDGDASCWW